MSNRNVFVAQIQQRVRDQDGILSAVDFDDSLDSALLEYSSLRDLWGVEDALSDGEIKTFAMPGGWIRDWSYFREILYIDSNSDPHEIDATEYSVEPIPPNSEQVRFRRAPAAGSVRFVYAIAHSATTSATTVPAPHFSALTMLGAIYATHMLSQRYAAQSDSNFSTDTADHMGRAERYQQRINAWRNEVDRLLPRRKRWAAQVVRV